MVLEPLPCPRLALQHFYRTVGFLAQVREDLEIRLFHRDLNLFNQTPEAVFIDTASLYRYRGAETEWRRRGDALMFSLAGPRPWPLSCPLRKPGGGLGTTVFSLLAISGTFSYTEGHGPSERTIFMERRMT